MYNLDINFLNDRPDLLERQVQRQVAPTQNLDQTPILIGAGVALALNALVAGAWFIFHQQNVDLTKERDTLVTTLGQKNLRSRSVR